MMLMRVRVVTAAVALCGWSGGVTAQEGPRSTPADSVMVEAWRGDLPADLVPPASTAVHSSVPAIQEGAPLVPVLFAIFGGIAGMFVGDWWMQRGCEENCEERGFLGLLVGGLVGTVVGWMIGGGEIPQEPPPGRWP